ncbi:hypothetical protein AVEN_241150-1 [Araneus ventricosus]|uniref:Uncharacterized protein n=1 Tax=Araneus ventricosus TaxID=182803 RepID=A0A4Y2DX31_ARAVE|nr:hypothetical protein AVEN_241150-1 [Araneus ventricosus]
MRKRFNHFTQFTNLAMICKVELPDISFTSIEDIFISNFIQKSWILDDEKPDWLLSHPCICRMQRVTCDDTSQGSRVQSVGFSNSNERNLKSDSLPRRNHEKRDFTFYTVHESCNDM